MIHVYVWNNTNLEFGDFTLSEQSKQANKKNKLIRKRIKKLSKNVNTKKGRSESQLSMAMRRFRKSKIGIIGIIIVILFFAVGFLATPFTLTVAYRDNQTFSLSWGGLPPFNPNDELYISGPNALFTSNESLNTSSPYAPAYQPPGTYTGFKTNSTGQRVPGSNTNWLGTNVNGQDEFSRLIMGTRISIFVSVVAILIAAFIGIFIGLLAGFYGGWVDELLMRITDIFLNLPFLLIIILVVNIFQNPNNQSLTNFLQNLNLTSELYIFVLVIGLGVFGWATIARLVRAQIFQIKSLDYVEAARALGTPSSRIMLRHILPNILVSLLVVLSIGTGSNIVIEAAISFLIPIDPNLASWGNEISDGFRHAVQAWWAILFPGICITIAVLGFNLLGDAITDAFDPRAR